MTKSRQAELPRVLVVEDNPAWCAWLCQTFEKADLKCEHAHSGEEAIVIARDHPSIKFAVIDETLNDPGGYQAAEFQGPDVVEEINRVRRGTVQFVFVTETPFKKVEGRFSEGGPTVQPLAVMDELTGEESRLKRLPNVIDVVHKRQIEKDEKDWDQWASWLIKTARKAISGPPEKDLELVVGIGFPSDYFDDAYRDPHADRVRANLSRGNEHRATDERLSSGEISRRVEDAKRAPYIWLNEYVAELAGFYRQNPNPDENYALYQEKLAECGDEDRAGRETLAELVGRAERKARQEVLDSLKQEIHQVEQGAPTAKERGLFIYSSKKTKAAFARVTRLKPHVGRKESVGFRVLRILGMKAAFGGPKTIDEHEYADAGFGWKQDQLQNTEGDESNARMDAVAFDEDEAPGCPVADDGIDADLDENDDLGIEERYEADLYAGGFQLQPGTRKGGRKTTAGQLKTCVVRLRTALGKDEGEGLEPATGSDLFPAVPREGNDVPVTYRADFEIRFFVYDADEILHWPRAPGQTRRRQRVRRRDLP